MAIFFPPPPVFTGGSQPYSQRKLNPSLLAISVDNPPFTYGGPFVLKAEVVSINQPALWTYAFLGGAGPYKTRVLIPASINVTPDNPPFTFQGRLPTSAEIVSTAQPNPWVYAFVGAQPYGKVLLTPSSLNVAPDNPPFGSRQVSQYAEIVSLNQKEVWAYTFTGRFAQTQPYGGNIAVPDIYKNTPVFSGGFSHGYIIF